jgi:hypothetical protein
LDYIVYQVNVVFFPHAGTEHRAIFPKWNLRDLAFYSITFDLVVSAVAVVNWIEA